MDHGTDKFVNVIFPEIWIGIGCKLGRNPTRGLRPTVQLAVLGDGCGFK